MHRSLVLRLATLSLLLASAAPAQDGDLEFTWPKVISGEGGEVTIFQPQIESFRGNVLESRSAVAV